MGLITFKQTGGKQVKPYVTNNPKDPRIQAYSDSLNLYNNNYQNKPILNFDKKDTMQNGWLKSMLGDKILPIGHYPIHLKEGMMTIEAAYKKPVQPVLYQLPKKTIKRIVNTKLQTQTPQPEQPKTPLITKKPVQYREEKVVMKVRVPNPERMDLGRTYNQAGNTHEEERTVIRRVPITENDKTTLSK